MSLLTPALRASAASTSRAFSTSSVLAAAKPKAGAPKLKKRVVKSFNKNKGAGGGGGGRIKAGGLTLKTTLAKEPAHLSDLVQLYPESVIPLNVAKASVFPRNTYDQLKTFGVSRRMDRELGHGAPASVIRQSTVDLVRRLESAKTAGSKSSRYMITGARGAGKSMLLAQAVSYALESGWIVLYAAEATAWINSSSSYAYDAASQTYHQPELASQLLSKLLAVNKDRLAAITLPADLEIGGSKVTGTLVDLAALGAKNENTAVPALAATFDILAKQTQFPVLVAIDEVQALFQPSKYRAPDYSLLESYHLSVPRLVLEYLSGVKEFSNGALVTALDLSNTSYLPRNELFAGIGLESRDPITPYTKLDEHHLKAASSGIKRVEVPFGMSGEEAAAMFDLWTRKGWAANHSDEVFVGALQASCGNPQELGREWRLSHQSYII